MIKVILSQNSALPDLDCSYTSDVITNKIFHISTLIPVFDFKITQNCDDVNGLCLLGQIDCSIKVPSLPKTQIGRTYASQFKKKLRYALIAKPFQTSSWSLFKLTNSWKSSGADTQMPTIKNIEGQMVSVGFSEKRNIWIHLGSVLKSSKIMNQSRWNSVCWNSAYYMLNVTLL